MPRTNHARSQLSDLHPHSLSFTSRANLLGASAFALTAFAQDILCETQLLRRAAVQIFECYLKWEHDVFTTAWTALTATAAEAATKQIEDVHSAAAAAAT